MELSPIYLYGKASGHTDFGWIDGHEPAPEICRAAEWWFRCHVGQVGDGSTVAGVRDAVGTYWLLRVTASGTDVGGRVVHSLVTGPVRQAGEDFNPAMAVLAAFLKQLPDRAAWDQQACSLPTPKGESPPEPARLPRLLAARLCDDDAVLVAESPAAAAAVLARLGPESLAWVAASSGALPLKSLPPGGGMVLVPSAHDPPAPEPGITALLDDGKIDLAALMTAAKSAARRRVLLAAAAGDSLEGELLSDAELDWLLGAPAGRPAALRAATLAQVDRLVVGGAIRSGEEVRTIAARLDGRSPEQSRAIAAILAKTGELEVFTAIFGPHPAGREEFLSPAARAFRDYLEAPDTLPRPEIDGWTEAIRELDQAAMLVKLPLRTLARFQRWPLVDHAFAGRLMQEGLPGEVSRWLVLGVPMAAPLREAPPLEPDVSWVAGLPAARLEALGRWMVGASAGARWWQAALAVHPEFAGTDLTDRAGPWRVGRGWLAVADRLHGQMPPEKLVPTFARWRGEGGPRWEEEVAFDMLRAAGLTVGTFLQVADGPDEPAARAAMENLDWLAGGLFDAREVVARLPVARLASAVGAWPARDPARALVDLGAPGPVVAPDGPLSPAIRAILLRFLWEKVFWDRWHDGVPPGIMQWLAEQTAMEPEGQTVAAVRDALDGTRMPEPPLLAVVGDGLPVGVLLRWATLARTEEEAKVYLGARALRSRPELADWLRERLADQQRGPWRPLPGLGAEEFGALLPVLEARHIHQWLDLHPEEVDPGSPFGRGLSARLRAGCALSQIALSQLPPHLAIYYRQN